MTIDCIWFNKSNFVPKEKNSKYHLTVIRFYRGRVLNNYDIIINFYELRDFVGHSIHISNATEIIEWCLNDKLNLMFLIFPPWKNCLSDIWSIKRHFWHYYILINQHKLPITNSVTLSEINPLEKGGFGVLSTETGFD